jgi:hypothetical protein
MVRRSDRHEKRCSDAHPTRMWVYYQLPKSLPCLYFDPAGNLICIERNDIVIASE